MGHGADVIDQRDDRNINLAVGAGLLCTLILGFASDGCYHDDDLTHFLFARWSSWFPSYLLHIWGRPGLTVPLAAVSGWGSLATGWHLARVLSALVTASSSLIAARLARRLGIERPWLVVALCYLQPLNTVLAATTLTENFASLYLVLACALLCRRRMIAGSIVFSLLLVTRHEALVLLPIWGLGLLFSEGKLQEKTGAALCTLWAPVLHNLLFWVVFKEWPIRMFSEPSGSHEYPATSILGYLPAALSAVPPVLAGLAIIGALAMFWRGQILIAALAGTFFLAQLLIKALGVFASGGYGRFLVTIAPLVAILCARGWQELTAQRQRPGAGRAGAIMAAVWLLGLWALLVEVRAGRIGLPNARMLYYAAGASIGMALTSLTVGFLWQRRQSLIRQLGALLLMATVLAQWTIMVRPLKLRDNQMCIRSVCQWLSESHLDRSPLFTTNAWFPYFLDIIEHPRAHKGPMLLASMPIGTIFIWDSIYSGSDFHGLQLDSTKGPYFEVLREFHGNGERPIEVKVLRKIKEMPMPASIPAIYPRDLVAERKPLLGIYYIRPGEKWPPISAGNDRGGVETSPIPRR